MWDLTLGLVELEEVAQAHFPNLSRSIWMASLPSSLSTAPQSLVSLLNSLGATVHISDIKHESQYGPLKNATSIQSWKWFSRLKCLHFLQVILS